MDVSIGLMHGQSWGGVGGSSYESGHLGPKFCFSRASVLWTTVLKIMFPSTQGTTDGVLI